MNIRLKYLILTAVIALQPMLASAATVKSLSLEVFKDVIVPYWEVTVLCDGVAKPHLMTRPLDREQWCSSTIKNICDVNKFILSRRLCDDSVSQQGDNDQPSINSAVSSTNVNAANIDSLKIKTDVVKDETPQSRESLLKEQMQIEEKRILIEQKYLELRRKEIALQKQNLDAD